MFDSCTLWVDHVGVLGESADALAQCFRRLGFQVVGPVELMGQGPDGEPQSLGQQSAHIMFGSDYIELTAVTEPTPDHHLAPFLRGAGGLRLLILGTDDIAADRARCAEFGLGPSDVGHATREVHYGAGGTARFDWFGLPIARYPEALVGFVQHQTPDTVFQSEVTSHKNSVTEISRVILQAETVPQRLKMLVDREGAKLLEAMPRRELEKMFSCDLRGLPSLSALGLHVADLDVTERCLSESQVAYVRTAIAVYVPPLEASGVGLIFEPALQDIA